MTSGRGGFGKVGIGKILKKEVERVIFPAFHDAGFVVQAGHEKWFGEYDRSGRCYEYPWMLEEVYPHICFIRVVVYSDGEVQIYGTFVEGDSEHRDMESYRKSISESGDIPYGAQFSGNLHGFKLMRLGRKILFWMPRSFSISGTWKSREAAERAARELIAEIQSLLPELWGFIFDGKRSKYVETNNDFRDFLKRNAPYWKFER